MNSQNVVIDAFLVSRLIASQFPQWKELSIDPVATSGWDNRTFHLGKDKSVRLPSAAEYELQVEKEHQWIPQLAPALPLPIPVPLAMGKPEYGYPWKWSIYRWIEGETASPEKIADLSEFAADLANFLAVLHKVNATDGPAPGLHSFYRGGALSVYDSDTRRSIANLKNNKEITNLSISNVTKHYINLQFCRLFCSQKSYGNSGIVLIINSSNSGTVKAM